MTETPSAPPKKFLQKYIIVSLLKTKDRFGLKAVREKWHITDGKNKSNDSVFLIRNHEEWKEITKYFSSAKRTVNQMKIYFRNEEELKTFTDGGKLRACVTSRSTLKRMAKENSVNQKEIKKEGLLKYQEERKNTEIKIWVNAFPLSS